MKPEKRPMDSSAAACPDDVRAQWESVVKEGDSEGASIKSSAFAPENDTGVGSASTDTPSAPRRNVATGEDGDGPGDFVLGELLGKGGMGLVFRAEQAGLDRDVALKTIIPDRAVDEEARRKFFAEARVTGQLDHPNIVPIYELATAPDGALFYTMKEVRGRPWSEAMPTLSEAENIDILLKVADAVAFAHGKGVIHRDLKPENVMLGDFGEVLLMDWGLAVGVTDEAKAERLSPGNARGGTPAYMAPEMAARDAERIGPASDIYLLGAILYEILTGLRPHHGQNVFACIFSALQNTIQPSDRRDEWMDVARRALSADPKDRPAGVKAFQRSVRACREHAASLALSKEARETLARAKQSGDYTDYARAVFGFGEALRMWPENNAADLGLTQARKTYAGAALERGDFDLALSQTEQITGGDAGDLARRAEAGKAERERRRVRVRRLTRLSAALAGLVLAVGSVAYWRVSKAEGEALAKADIATEAERKATAALASETAARETADQARRQAVVARTEAETARDEAVESERKAVAAATAEAEARKAAELAKQQADEALAEAQRAEKLRAEAQAASRVSEKKAAEAVVEIRIGREKQAQTAGDFTALARRVGLLSDLETVEDGLGDMNDIIVPTGLPEAAAELIPWTDDLPRKARVLAALAVSARTEEECFALAKAFEELARQATRRKMDGLAGKAAELRDLLVKRMEGQFAASAPLQAMLRPATPAWDYAHGAEPALIGRLSDDPRKINLAGIGGPATEACFAEIFGELCGDTAGNLYFRVREWQIGENGERTVSNPRFLRLDSASGVVAEFAVKDADGRALGVAERERPMAADVLNRLYLAVSRPDESAWSVPALWRAAPDSGRAELIGGFKGFEGQFAWKVGDRYPRTQIPFSDAWDGNGQLTTLTVGPDMAVYMMIGPAAVRLREGEDEAEVIWVKPQGYNSYRPLDILRPTTVLKKVKKRVHKMVIKRIIMEDGTEKDVEAAIMEEVEEDVEMPAGDIRLIRRVSCADGGEGKDCYATTVLPGEEEVAIPPQALSPSVASEDAYAAVAVAYDSVPGAVGCGIRSAVLRKGKRARGGCRPAKPVCGPCGQRELAPLLAVRKNGTVLVNPGGFPGVWELLPGGRTRVQLWEFDADDTLPLSPMWWMLTPGDDLLMGMATNQNRDNWRLAVARLADAIDGSGMSAAPAPRNADAAVRPDLWPWRKWTGNESAQAWPLTLVAPRLDPDDWGMGVHAFTADGGGLWLVKANMIRANNGTLQPRGCQLGRIDFPELNRCDATKFWRARNRNEGARAKFHAAMTEANPEYNPRATRLVLRDGMVTEAEFSPESNVSSLTPLAGSALESLTVQYGHPLDFTPLKGLPLRWLAAGPGGESMDDADEDSILLKAAGFADFDEVEAKYGKRPEGEEEESWYKRIYADRLEVKYGKFPENPEDMEELFLRIEADVLEPMQISGLDALSGMPLEELVLVGGAVRDLNRLADGLGGTKVPVLDLSQNLLTDAAGLERLDFDEIDLSENLIPHVDNLSGCRGKIYDLTDNRITRMPALERFACERLDLAGNPITEMGSLVRARIGELRINQYVYQSDVAHPHPLKAWPDSTGAKIGMLAANKVGLEDIAGLSGAEVENLFLGHNEIADLRPLAGKTFKELYLPNNKIADITPLAECVVDQLNVDKNPFTDVSVLRGAKGIRSLSVPMNTQGWTVFVPAQPGGGFSDENLERLRPAVDLTEWLKEHPGWEWDRYALKMESQHSRSENVVADLKALPPELRVLDLSSFHLMKDEHLAPLERLKSLRVLKLRTWGGHDGITGAGLSHVKGLADLRELDLGAVPFGDDDLKLLGDLTGLESLGMTANKITEVGLRNLLGLKSLRKLALRNAKDPDQLLRRLKHWPALAELDLHYSAELTAAGLAHLAGMKNLRVLKLDGTHLTDQDVDALQKLKDLEELSIRRTGITSAGRDRLERRLTLKRLSYEALPEREVFPIRIKGWLKDHPRWGTNYYGLVARENVEDADLAAVAALEPPPIGLDFNYRGSKLTPVGLAHLSKLTSLNRLDLTSVPMDRESLSHLQGLANLQVLSLHRTEIGDADLALLLRLTRLSDLNLSGTPITGEGLAALSALPDLQTLHFSGTHATDAGLMALERWGALRNLYLSGNESAFTDAGLAHVGRLKGLRLLRLVGFNGMTRASLDALAGNADLEDLGLHNKKVTADVLRGLSSLSTLKQLKRLGLDGTEAGDEHLALVAKFPGLETLSLYHCGAVTDAGLARLSDMKLKRIDVRKTGITKEGIAAFRQKQPECHIQADG